MNNINVENYLKASSLFELMNEAEKATGLLIMHSNDGFYCQCTTHDTPDQNNPFTIAASRILSEKGFSIKLIGKKHIRCCVSLTPVTIGMNVKYFK